MEAEEEKLVSEWAHARFGDDTILRDRSITLAMDAIQITGMDFEDPDDLANTIMMIAAKMFDFMKGQK